MCPCLRDTVKPVDSCPKSAQEYAEKASIFNCPEMCDYHCVLNTMRTSLVELCAPTKLINGKVCPEYNYKGGIVQRNVYAPCDACPEMYRSNETFKYIECITTTDDVTSTTLPQTQSIQKPNSVSSISLETADAKTSCFSPLLRSTVMLFGLPSMASFLYLFGE